MHDVPLQRNKILGEGMMKEVSVRVLLNHCSLNLKPS